MDVVVDLGAADVAVHEPENLRGFAVRVLGGASGDADRTADLAAADALLTQQGAGRVDPGGDVFVPPDAVRRLAARAAVEAGGALPAGWEDDFAGMLGYAASKGWIADDGAIQAHVEWGPA
jgi:hypothetical protein